MTPEELELLNDIRVFTSVFYVILKPSRSNGYSHLSRVIYMYENRPFSLVHFVFPIQIM